MAAAQLKLAGVPFHEGFGFCGDVQVLVHACVRLAELGIAELDQQPLPLRSASIVATSGAPPAGNRSNTSSPPWPASSPASSGRR
jgi:hypothetical protein